MPQTNNFGLPLWGDHPPEGATGKTLRDAIIGESPSSLANMVDSAMNEIDSSKIGTSSVVKKGESFPDTEADEKIPSMGRMLEAVDAANKTAKQDASQYARALGGYIPSDTVTWDGNAAGKSHFLDGMYKISDSTTAPKAFSIDLSTKKSNQYPSPYDYAGSYIAVNQNVELSDRGIEVYAYAFGLVIVCSQGGTLTQEEAESIFGDYGGEDFGYEAGTYFSSFKFFGEFVFVSSATKLSDQSVAVETVESIWGDIAPGKIPSTSAVFYFVEDMAIDTQVRAYSFSAMSSMDAIASVLKSLNHHLTWSYTWDGSTDGLETVNGSYYKISASCSTPKAFVAHIDFNLGLEYYALLTPEKDPETGIVYYKFRNTIYGDIPLVAVAKSSGIGADGESWTSGTYLFSGDTNEIHFEVHEITAVENTVGQADLPMFPPILWDGDITGLTDFLGIFYRVSDRVDLPEKFNVEASEIKNGQKAYGIQESITDYVENALKEAYGLTIYSATAVEQTAPGTTITYQQPCIVVADRAGTLPAAVIEQMMGTNPGADVPYEKGTYFYRQARSNGYVAFVSKAENPQTVKGYIDQKFEELQVLIGTNEGG